MSSTKIKVAIRSFRDKLIKLCYPSLSDAFSIESHLTIQERICLNKLSRDKKFILEIGSYIGASAVCFALNSTSWKKIICIDTWNNDAMSEGYRDTWNEFQINIGSHHNNIIPIRGYSTDVYEKVEKISDSFDVVFIDGDHSYEGVKADWECYKNFLKIGSIIIFHDYGWAEGVKRVVEEDVLPLVTKQSNLPNMWWGTIKKTP